MGWGGVAAPAPPELAKPAGRPLVSVEAGVARVPAGRGWAAAPRGRPGPAGPGRRVTGPSLLRKGRAVREVGVEVAPVR